MKIYHDKELAVGKCFVEGTGLGSPQRYWEITKVDENRVWLEAIGGGVETLRSRKEMSAALENGSWKRYEDYNWVPR